MSDTNKMSVGQTVSVGGDNFIIMWQVDINGILWLNDGKNNFIRVKDVRAWDSKGELIEVKI